VKNNIIPIPVNQATRKTLWAFELAQLDQGQADEDTAMAAMTAADIKAVAETAEREARRCALGYPDRQNGPLLDHDLLAVFTARLADRS
jgi:hypothetical protein